MRPERRFLFPSDIPTATHAVHSIMRNALLILAALFASTRTAAAQSKVVGRWLVHYEHETRGVHVGTPQLVVDSVRMTLRQRGDSILGEWQAIVPAGETAAHPRDLRGIARGDTVRMQLDPNISESEGFFSELGREIIEFLKTHVHGIPPMTPFIEVAVRGDSLVGARWSASADFSVESPRRALKAIRETP
jgi:hypothetical protein